MIPSVPLYLIGKKYINGDLGLQSLSVLNGTLDISYYYYYFLLLLLFPIITYVTELWDSVIGLIYSAKKTLDFYSMLFYEYNNNIT